ncbi:MAG TPA: SNF2-related protein [Bacillales bacterium]|nr:SNF2-related protein [Bacillales bacterium]
MNRLFLEMTYIPTMDEDSFFVWLTDEKGNPGVPNPARILTNSRRRLKYFRMNLTNHSVAFENEDGTQSEVSGCFLPMWEMFRFLMDSDMLDDEIHPGKTFPFWVRLAKSLSVLLESGQYYPTWLTVEKEEKCYVFSQWMLSRQALGSGQLFNEWIRMIPEEVLSVLELASFGIRQWLSILLDTWSDRIIRNLLAPSYPWRRSEFATPDVSQRWANDLKQPGNLCFLTTEDPERIQEIQKLKDECEQWHSRIAGKSRPDPKETLERFKYTKVGLDLDPVSLLLCMEPDDHEEPFHPDESWTIQLKVAVSDRKRDRLLDGEEACRRHLSIRQWLHHKFDQLERVHPVFRTFGYQMYDNDFVFQCLTSDLTAFYAKVGEYNVSVRFPEWMKIKSRGDEDPDVRLESEVKETEKRFTLESLVDFNWQVSVGDLSLSMDQFKELIDQQQRFLRYQDEWVELPLEKMKAAYEEMAETENFIGRKGKMADLLRMSIAEKQRKPQFVSIESRPETHHYLEMLLQPAGNRRKRVPARFKGALRPYQKRGFAWLDEQRKKGVGVCLADDMGLGKTIQAIVYLLAGKKGSGAVPYLIVCPTSLIENWKRELHRFAPTLEIYSHHGSTRLKGEDFEKQIPAFDVVITSYNLATRDHSLLSAIHWQSIIIDEAQAIKNPATKQSRALRSLEAGHRVALTGTPMENHLEELWSIMDFLNPGYLGSLQGFRRHFVKPVEKDNDKQKVEMIRRFVQPFLLRREKSDRSIIRDLPEKIEKKEYCHLTREQASLYQSIVNELMHKMKHASGIERKGLILASLTRLKQLCDHPQLVLKNTPVYEHSGKLVHFSGVMDALLSGGRSALVFTQYVKMGHMLQAFIRETFPDCPVYFMHGGLSSVKREQLITEFREQDRRAVFILSLKTGGVGLNLTEASDVIHYDRWWNPAVENQATDRAHRIGQSKNVHVHKLISIGTLEERIDEMIEQKKALTEQVIGQGDGWVTEMNDDEVYDLIRLRKKEVAT